MTTFPLPIATPLPRITDALLVLEGLRKHVPSKTFYALGVEPTTVVDVDDQNRSITLRGVLIRTVDTGVAYPADITLTARTAAFDRFDVRVSWSGKFVNIRHEDLTPDQLVDILNTLAYG